MSPKGEAGELKQAVTAGVAVPASGAQGLLFTEDLPVLDEDAGYRGPTACKAAGITYRQLDYWARTGLVEPAVRGAALPAASSPHAARSLIASRSALRHAGMRTPKAFSSSCNRGSHAPAGPPSPHIPRWKQAKSAESPVRADAGRLPRTPRGRSRTRSSNRRRPGDRRPRDRRCRARRWQSSRVRSSGPRSAHGLIVHHAQFRLDAGLLEDRQHEVAAAHRVHPLRAQDHEAIAGLPHRLLAGEFRPAIDALRVRRVARQVGRGLRGRRRCNRWSSARSLRRRIGPCASTPTASALISRADPARSRPDRRLCSRSH